MTKLFILGLAACMLLVPLVTIGIYLLLTHLTPLARPLYALLFVGGAFYYHRWLTKKERIWQRRN